MSEKKESTTQLWQELPTPYEQLLLYQMFIAFAHGAGGLWIRRKTCQGIHRFSLYVLRHPQNILKMDPEKDPWKDMGHGTQVLLRYEAIGRLAAHYATLAGLPEIRVQHFLDAATEVIQASIETNKKRRKKQAVATGGDECAWCPPPNGDPPPPTLAQLEAGD